MIFSRLKPGDYQKRHGLPMSLVDRIRLYLSIRICPDGYVVQRVVVQTPVPEGFVQRRCTIVRKPKRKPRPITDAEIMGVMQRGVEKEERSELARQDVKI